jgi:hypothetical protein
MAGFFGATSLNFLGNFNISLDFSVNLLGSFVGFGGVPFTPPVLPPVVINVPPVVDTTRVITSMSSTVAFHTTLFEDLALRAEGVYNFYTNDEQSTFVSNPSASLDTLPRYVVLDWNPAAAPRDFTLSRKGLRPFDPRTPTAPSALEVPIARNAVANGYVAPGAIQALLVAPVVPEVTPEFNEDLFLTSPAGAGRAAAFESGEESEFHVQSIPSPSARIRVNFVDPSIAGALSENRILLASDHTHLAALGAFAKLASGLEVVSEFNQDVPPSNPVPQFPAIASTPDLMYIGYVIERYMLDPSGSMELTRTVVIDDPGQSSFVDREVVYGGRYSYRIRSLVQWTHGPNVGFFGSSSLDRSPPFNTARGSAIRQASFYAAEWSDWARVAVLDTEPPDPPDELTVMPLSQKGRVRITWKMPNDPQRDIASITLLRSTGLGGRYTDWVKLGAFVPANGVFVDTAVKPHETSHESYMYAMYSTSFHGERSVLSERIVARLTDRSRYLGEEPVRLAGPRGMDPTDHALGPVPPLPNELVAQDSFRVYIRGAESALPLFDRSYVIEVQSLATGERAEVILDVDTTDVGLTSGGTARSA